ncbi:MAG TPA: hypothetical protein VFV87_01735 [Pirellulaceae bacterium]|nr:hypothetical protein [Pirellulaceae bacterium]
MRSQLSLALLFVFLSGCEPPQAPPGSAPAPPGAAPTMSATSVWSQTQVEEFFKEEFQFTTIALKSTGGHNYQGTGVDPEGLTYTLTFQQVPGGYKAEWSTESGNGAITFGNPVP